MEYDISQKAQDLINRVQDFINKEVAHNEVLYHEQSKDADGNWTIPPIMEEMKAKIQAMITASPTLSPFKNQLLLDLTTEGLRLQIVDQTNRPMFDQGSAHLRYYSEDILWELAPMLSGLRFATRYIMTACLAKFGMNSLIKGMP